MLLVLALYNVPSILNWFMSPYFHRQPWKYSVAFLAIEIMPIIVAVVAIIVARRKTWAERAMWGLLVSYVWSGVWGATTAMLGVAVRNFSMPYVSFGVIATLAALFVCGVVIMLDRLWHPAGTLRRWRVMGGIVIVTTAFAVPFLSQATNVSADWSSITIPAATLLIVIISPLLLRRLSGIERAKRILLAFIFAMAVGAVASAVLTAPGTYGWGLFHVNEQVLSIAPMGVALISYGAGMWLLWPKAPWAMKEKY